MLAVLAFLAAPPPAFVRLVEQRLAATQTHLVAWWADDLDGDHQLESIAVACNEEGGTYMIERGEMWFELPAEFDGRNPCPDATPTRPTWRIEHAGAIRRSQNVHHGEMSDTFAIRDGKLVEISSSSSGFEVGRNGNTDEADEADYEALTWAEDRTPPDGKRVHRTGSWVLVTDRVRRPTKLVGATTIAATTTGSDAGSDDGANSYHLHVHADRTLVIEPDCDGDDSCAAIRVTRGDHELSLTYGNDLTVTAGGTRFHLRLMPVDGDASYPAAR